jgi:hypothetical protein
MMLTGHIPPSPTWATRRATFCSERGQAAVEELHETLPTSTEPCGRVTASVARPAR